MFIIHKGLRSIGVLDRSIHVACLTVVLTSSRFVLRSYSYVYFQWLRWHFAETSCGWRITEIQWITCFLRPSASDEMGINNEVYTDRWALSRLGNNPHDTVLQLYKMSMSTKFTHRLHQMLLYKTDIAPLRLFNVSQFANWKHFNKIIERIHTHNFLRFAACRKCDKVAKSADVPVKCVPCPTPGYREPVGKHAGLVHPHRTKPLSYRWNKS